jgi:hypothetical protein
MREIKRLVLLLTRIQQHESKRHLSGATVANELPSQRLVLTFIFESSRYKRDKGSFQSFIQDIEQGALHCQ